MKENEYPNIDEERGLDMVAEPAVAVGYRPTEVVDTIDYELRGHDFGMPHTIIELKAELEEADREMDDPDKWCTSEQMKNHGDGSGDLFIKMDNFLCKQSEQVRAADGVWLKDVVCMRSDG